jgi:hypothetical protein
MALATERRNVARVHNVLLRGTDPISLWRLTGLVKRLWAPLKMSPSIPCC